MADGPISHDGHVLGLVPARGGSKRIPRKNIRPFHGTPLIAHTLSMMLDSGVFDRVIVSTDDDEIADIALAAGAEVPFKRPADLADDTTGTGDVVRHAISELQHESYDVAALCLVYPAALFVTADDLAGSLDLLGEGDCDFVFSASTFPSPIQRALRQRPGGLSEMIWPEHLMSRSQDLEATYHDVGQFYWGRREAWQAGKRVLGAHSRMWLIPPWRVQDIDTIEDWTRAELLYQLLDEHRWAHRVDE